MIEKHKDEILKYCGREAMGNHYCSVAIKYYLHLKDNLHAMEFFSRAREYGVKYHKLRTVVHIAALRISTFSPQLALRLQMLYRATQRE